MHGHHSAPGMLEKLGRQPWLKYLGVFGIFTHLTVAAYYCYLESWTLLRLVLADRQFHEQDPAKFLPLHRHAEGALRHARSRPSGFFPPRWA